jgi:hypothetical protein
MADQARGPFKMEVVLLSTKVWVSLRQRHDNIDGADRLPAFRIPVGTHDEIEQIIHTSLLATAEAKVCPCQFSPDKSTVR